MGLVYINDVFSIILKENEFYKIGDHKSVICHLEKQKSSKSYNMDS